MLYCDVCEQILLIDESDFSSDDEEGVQLVCPYCGYDNAYQIINSYNDIFEQELESFFLDANNVIDDDVLIEAFAERFGISKLDVIEMIRQKEILGWDLKVNIKKDTDS